jgi:hypothetical protein
MLSLMGPVTEAKADEFIPVDKDYSSSETLEDELGLVDEVADG